MEGFTIGPRTKVRDGIQSSYAFTVTERVINGKRYHFGRHHFVGVSASNHAGIEVWLADDDGVIIGEKRLIAGEPMPEFASSWRKTAAEQEREDIARAQALGFRLMVSRYPGMCKGCGKPFAKGARIWYAKNNTRHEGCNQAAAAAAPTRSAPRGRRYGRYAYTSSGARMTDRHSRCEDAPCCGCCD